MGGRAVRFALIVCLLIAAAGLFVASPALAAPTFVDVPADNVAYTAVEALAARGIIKGCDADAHRFCPDDPTLRAQMAALIARAAGWDAEDHGNQFADRCDVQAGCIDADLWRNVGTLQYYGVAKGYDASSYGPHNDVLRQQVILFISRALVHAGTWQRKADDASVYPNLPRGTDAERLDAADVVTYVAYVGAVPDTQANATWDAYAAPSARAWFARALWQALAPTATPIPPSPSPSPSPVANYQVSATVSDTSPTQNTRVTVTGRLTNNGQGVTGATMATTWHYKTTAPGCTGGPSSADGTTSCTRDISTATKGYTVVIDVQITYQGQTFTTSTSFTPR